MCVKLILDFLPIPNAFRITFCVGLGKMNEDNTLKQIQYVLKNKCLNSNISHDNIDRTMTRAGITHQAAANNHK